MKRQRGQTEYLGFTVLDDMSLIKDHIIPLDEGEEVYVISYNVIRSDHQVVLREESPQSENEREESHQQQNQNIDSSAVIVRDFVFTSGLVQSQIFFCFHGG